MRKTLASLFLLAVIVASPLHAATVSKQFILTLGPDYTGLAASITYKVVYVSATDGTETVAVAETTGTGVTEDTIGGGPAGVYYINVASFDTTKSGRVVWKVGGGYNLVSVDSFGVTQSTDNATALATINTNVNTANATLGTNATAVTAIKAKTDNLPASPAAVGSAMTVADKTGYKLASDGLDSISTTLPSTAANWNFRQMMVMINQWTFGPTDKDVEPGKLRVLAPDGSTVITRQNYTSNGTSDVKSAAQ